MFLHSLIFWLWLESIIGNQCVCTVLFGYVLKRCRKMFLAQFGFLVMIKKHYRKPIFFSHFCLVMLKKHVGNQCFCTVLFSGDDEKPLSETNVFAQFDFLVMIRTHYRKPMCLHSFVWLCFKKMSETNVFAQFCFLAMLKKLVGNQCF